jgi:small subunit ribosomal protein S15
MLTPEEKLKIIKEFRTHPEDTGSLEVQIGLLTEEIKRLVSHLKLSSKRFSFKKRTLKNGGQKEKIFKPIKKRKSPKISSNLK